jgi:hypothetical protein
MKQLRNIVLSQHACARMRENGLTYDDVVVLWENAVEEERDDHHFGYDFLHHSITQFRNTKYYRSKEYRFIVDTKNVVGPKVITLFKLSENTKKN